jgi:phenylpropionate dioxygenase-like ring-hydroxylating dioxygenase large terminal subunit
MTLTQLPADAAERQLRPAAATDARDEVPTLGYPNYWYPAAPSNAVGKQPLAIKLLGENIVLFRSNGRVYALEDRCAHRGTPLSIGKVRFPGTITCAYHGWTFDATGQCVAALTEGPHSALPGKACIGSYPVEERANIVWVFIGDIEPPPVETDIPEDLFTDEDLVFPVVSTWRANWRLAIENVADPSHAPYMHRTALRFLFVKYRAYSRIQATDNERGDGFFINPGPVELERAGTEFPGVGRYPERIWWRRMSFPLKRTMNNGSQSELRLPGCLRTNNVYWFFLQWSVPVDAATSRQFIWVLRPQAAHGLKAVWWQAYWHLFYRFLMDQFIDQDRVVVEAQETNGAFALPEKLSVNDTGVIRWRRLAARARGSRVRPDGVE